MQIIQSVQPDPNTRSTVPTVAALELFAGIGGAAIALRSISAGVRVAVDIDLHALQVYRDNFPSHQTIAAEIASLDLSQFASNFWWLSPPCLPFTSKGRQRDLDDRRTDSLVAVLKQIPALLPEFVVLENVPPFAESRACRLTSALLEANGYQVAIEVRCPTELGYPMRRRRCFVVASRRGLRDLQPMSQPFKPLRTFLDPPDTPQRSVPETLHKAYRSAMDIVDEADPHAIVACFASAYGRSPIRSGSYLRLSDGTLRHFSPREILRLLGFPDTFSMAACRDWRQAWSLLGNSLSIPVVEWILTRLVAS